MRDFIEEQAVDFSNSHYFGYVASVHLEDAEDEFFWNSLLQKIKPGKYNFIYRSKSKKGNDTSGCEQCLRFLPYLSKVFFVCIDSDLRFLLNEVAIRKENFVSQSYTYSWESHYCIPKFINQRLRSYSLSGQEDFDFEIFLKHYSEVLYVPFVFLLFLKLKGIGNDFEKSFNECLPKQCPRLAISNNGEGLIKRVEADLKKLCEGHSLWESFSSDLEIKNINSSFLSSDKTYLFVRGHNIFELIKYIGEKYLCRNTGVSFENDILNKIFDPNSTYSELDTIIRDLEFILI